VKYLTLRQADSEAPCSERTIRRAIKSGDLEGFMCGGKWVVRPDALHEWIQREPLRSSHRKADKRRRMRDSEGRGSRRETTLDRVKKLRTAA
jgi:excisionase family DNA binding protein